MIDYIAIGDVGTVLNPRSLGGQLFGGSMLGLGHALSQQWAYDQQYGVALARRFYHNKPPTILDAPQNFAWRRGQHSRSGNADRHARRRRAAGRRGLRRDDERARGCASATRSFRRSPVTPDMLLMALENGGNRTHEPLTAHI